MEEIRNNILTSPFIKVNSWNEFNKLKINICSKEIIISPGIDLLFYKVINIIKDKYPERNNSKLWSKHKQFYSDDIYKILETQIVSVYQMLQLNIDDENIILILVEYVNQVLY